MEQLESSGKYEGVNRMRSQVPRATVRHVTHDVYPPEETRSSRSKGVASGQDGLPHLARRAVSQEALVQEVALDVHRRVAEHGEVVHAAQARVVQSGVRAPGDLVHDDPLHDAHYKRLLPHLQNAEKYMRVAQN